MFDSDLNKPLHSETAVTADLFIFVQYLFAYVYIPSLQPLDISNEPADRHFYRVLTNDVVAKL